MIETSLWANPLFWGPEIGFARQLAADGVNDFLFVKASRGGGGNSYWLKGSRDDHMYRHVVETVQQAVKALLQGVTFEVAALLYIQGESDSPAEAAASGERLKTLVENLRKSRRTLGVVERGAQKGDVVARKGPAQERLSDRARKVAEDLQMPLNWQASDKSIANY